MVTVKTKKLIIRCNYDTWKRFRKWVLENDFKNSEEALKYLLKKAEELMLKPERAGKPL